MVVVFHMTPWRVRTHSLIWARLSHGFRNLSLPSLWMSASVYGIRGPEYGHPSVTGIARIMEQAGDLHAILPPVDAFPFLR